MKGISVTELEKIKMNEMCLEGIPYRGIANTFGYALSTVAIYITKETIEIKKEQLEILRNKIFDMYNNQDMPAKAISMELRVGINQVCKYANDFSRAKV